LIFSESNKEIAAALAKAWAEIENPKHNSTVKVKTKNGSSYTFDYTDLGGIFDEAKRVFKDNGITVIQNAFTKHDSGPPSVCVETMLLHQSGEWVKSFPLSIPANQNIQDMGGQITYLKRYSLSAMLGISTEKDDDANGASGNDYQYNKKHSLGQQSGSKQATDKQLDTVTNLIKKKVNDKYNEQQLYELLKERIKTDKEMKDWTVDEASRAIKFLTNNSAA